MKGVAASTVDTETFQKWLKERICLVLEDYYKCEKNSIVVMDNASTQEHISYTLLHTHLICC